MKTLLLAAALVALAVGSAGCSEAEAANPGTAFSGFPFQAFTSQIVDLTTTGTYQVIPPMGRRLFRSSANWEWKTVSGTISTNATYQGGCNSTVDDTFPSHTPTGFTTAAVETNSGAPSSFVSPTPVCDLTSFGFRVKVTVAVTGTTPVLKGKFIQLGALLPK